MHVATREEFAKAAQREANTYLTAPTEAALLRILALPKLVVGRTVADTRALLRIFQRGNIHTAIQHRLDSLPRRPPQRVHPLPPPLDDGEVPLLSQKEKNKVANMIKMGHVSRAAKVVTGAAGVATATPEVLEQLRAKHPQGIPNPFGARAGTMPHPFQDTEVATLDQLVTTLNMETSPGISGWTPQLLRLAYGTPERDTPFRRCLFKIGRQMLAGSAPGAAMLTTSRLTPLQQGAKIRPVACGELFYRLLTRFILRVQGTDRSLLPVQLGVGTPGGVEPLVHHLHQEMLRMEDDAEPDRHAYCLDMTNAFNATSRTVIANAVHKYAQNYYRLARWAYNQRSPLVVRTPEGVEVLWSCEGVRQGCPLGPFFFSLALRDKLERLGTQVASSPQDRLAAYLDDMILVANNPDHKAAIVNFFANDNTNDGFQLNANKTTVHSLREIRQDPTGLKVLGSVVGNTEARRQFLRDKIDDLRPTLMRLRQLPKQQALVLLRQVYAPQLRHLLRTMDLSDLQDDLLVLDNLLFDTMDFLRGAPDPTQQQRPHVVETIYSLPLSMGGCGLLSYTKTRHAAWEASQLSARQVLAHMWPHPAPPEQQDHPDQHVDPPKQSTLCRQIYQQELTSLLEGLSDDQRVAFLDNSGKAGTAWLHALPWTNGYRSLTDSQVAGALNIRTLQADLYGRALCDRCGLPNGPLHFEVCTAISRPQHQRHNHVRDILVKAIKKADRIVEIEPPIRPGTLRRADIRVGTAGRGQAMDPAYGLIDLKIKAPLTAHSAAPRAAAAANAPLDHGHHEQEHEQEQEQDEPVAGEALLRSIRKRGWAQLTASLDFAAKNAHAIYANLNPVQPVVPLVMSSGGTLHPEALRLIKELIPSPQARQQMCMDISLALIRGRTAAYHLE